MKSALAKHLLSLVPPSQQTEEVRTHFLDEMAFSDSNKNASIYSGRQTSIYKERKQGNDKYVQQLITAHIHSQIISNATDPPSEPYQ